MKKKMIMYAIGMIAGALIVAGLMLSSAGVKACDEVYFKVGAGYKFSEQQRFNHNGIVYHFDHISPYSARFELGVQKGNLSYGIGHYSQWSTGWPVSDEGEPHRSEIFVDYKFQLWGI